MLEVLNGGAFAQEFWIGDDGNVGIGPAFMDDARDLIAGPHRDRRFGDDYGEAADRGGDLARGGIDVRQISVAVAATGGGADRDENGRRCRYRCGQIRCE